MSPKTGRPKIDNAKATQLAVRLTDEEIEMLDVCALHYKATRSETLRIGLRKLYEGTKKK